MPRLPSVLCQHQDIRSTDADRSCNGSACSAHPSCESGQRSLFIQAAEQLAQVVEELLKYLVVADYSMREEIVLKTAVLAERFFPSLEWYVDSMLTLIERAGEFASKDVW